MELNVRKSTSLESSLPLPPNTCISSCSRRYIRNVLTCGSKPNKKTIGEANKKPSKDQQNTNDTMVLVFSSNVA